MAEKLIYGKEGRLFCAQARADLSDYTYIDVGQDFSRLQEMLQLRMMQRVVPVLGLQFLQPLFQLLSARDTAHALDLAAHDQGWRVPITPNEAISLGFVICSTSTARPSLASTSMTSLCMLSHLEQPGPRTFTPEP